MTRGLRRLRELGFRPAGILDIGAHDGAFAREARQVFPEAPILMLEALAEKEAVLEGVARALGNASYRIVLLGEEDAEGDRELVARDESATVESAVQTR